MPDPADPADIELLIEAVKNRRKLPRAFIKTLEDIEKAEEDTTRRIFYNHGGVTAWAAYELTKKLAEDKGHTHLKGKRQRLLERIDGQTMSERQALARQVAAAIEPDRERLEHMVNKARARRLPDRERYTNRRSTITANNINIEEAPHDPRDGDTDSMDTQTNSAAHNSETLAPDLEPCPGASAAACGKLFPPYLAAAIKKTTDRDQGMLAAVSMTLQDRGEVELRLEITANRVEYIAKELFDAHLETSDGLRYLYLAGTTRAIPNPSLIVTGCRFASISHIFGQRIADAVSSTIAYQRDTTEGRDCTDAIYMEIQQTNLESAVICLTLPAQGAQAIRHQLYG